MAPVHRKYTELTAWRARGAAQVVPERRLWALCAGPFGSEGAQRSLFLVLQG
jgi:hypothetical protein